MTARYRIVCVDRPESAAEHRRHITGIGTVEAHGIRRHWGDIGAVRDAMAHGDRFFTASRTSKRTAAVEPYDCTCGAETIRSNPDDVAEKDLDNMVACPSQ